jgi:hypothetical protein
MDRPLALQEVAAPRISKQLAIEGGKVVSPQEISLVLISVKRLSRPQGLVRLKDYVTHR